MNRDPETRSSIERMSAAIAGDRVPDLADMTRVLRAAEEHDRGMPRRPYPPPRSGQQWAEATVAWLTWKHGEDTTTWLAWWSQYDQQWISATEGPIDRSLPLLVDPLVVLDFSPWPGSQDAGRRAAAAQLYLAAEDSDGERHRLLTWLADQIRPDEAEVPPTGDVRDVPYVHAVLYRDHVLGSLCNSGAWGTPELFTAVTQEVTCPGCRDKLEGARA